MKKAPLAPRLPVTVTKGDGWRQYLTAMPHPLMRPIGTAKVGATLEGALVLDAGEGKYKLIEQNGERHDVDYGQVRDALALPAGPGNSSPFLPPQNRSG
jgi:hypothetical protein